MKRTGTMRLSACLIALLLVAISRADEPTAADIKPDPETLKSLEQKINEMRESYGLKKLTVVADLSKKAQQHANWMKDNGLFTDAWVIRRSLLVARKHQTERSMPGSVRGDIVPSCWADISVTGLVVWSWRIGTIGLLFSNKIVTSRVFSMPSVKRTVLSRSPRMA